MKHLKLLLLGLCSFIICSAADAANSNEDNTLLSDKNERDLIQAANFKCPFGFGTFADPTDCAHFYICIAGRAYRNKCNMFMKFDILRKRCMPAFVAVCGDEEGKETAPPPDTVAPEPTSAPVTIFFCPSISGSYPNQDDCSKYYTCTFFMPSSKTCPNKQLFDAEERKCKPEENVNCGNRKRPGVTTIEPTTIIGTETATDGTTETVTDTTTETVTDTTTVKVETPKEDIITTISTTSRPTGPPEHDCDEDDLDCIITETNEVSDWFICPQDVGSYPHPSSDRLFIFCMNWVPLAKKCGQNLEFSKELSTCVEIKSLM